MASETYSRLERTALAKIRAPWGLQALQGLSAGALLGVGAMNANLVEASFVATPASNLEQ